MTVGLSGSIGLFFGVVPARRAAKLGPDRGSQKPLTNNTAVAATALQSLNIYSSSHESALASSALWLLPIGVVLLIAGRS